MLYEINSQYVRWFLEIEKELEAFFRLFQFLCERCYLDTIEKVRNHQRDGRQYWCCCLIDNQVHDCWPSLDAIQKRFTTDWYQKLRQRDSLPVKARMPGNGPCPALGLSGCMIKKCRPITCTTQICEKMLYILKRLKVVILDNSQPLQIEGIISLPDILPELFGLRNRKKVSKEDVQRYKDAVIQLRKKLLSIPEKDRRLRIEESLSHYFGKGGWTK